MSGVGQEAGKMKRRLEFVPRRMQDIDRYADRIEESDPPDMDWLPDDEPIECIARSMAGGRIGAPL